MTETISKSSPPRSRRLLHTGPLTVYDADAFKIQLQAMLEHPDAGDWEMDLAQVTEVDTAGLQLLLLAQRESRRQRRTLRIAASAAVLEIIRFCELDDFFRDALTPGTRS